MNTDQLQAKVTEILESDDQRLAISLALIEARSDGYQDAMDRSLQIQAEIFGTGGQPNDNRT